LLNLHIQWDNIKNYTQIIFINTNDTKN
jgi:hypothetical protein